MSGKRMQILVALAAAGAVFAAAPAGAQATTPAKMSHRAMKKQMGPQALVKVKEAKPGLAAQATVSADSAQKLALAQVSRGWIKEAELEEEKGTLVYSYDIKVGGKSGIDEVLIDAKTGAVVSKTHESKAAEKKEMADEKMEKMEKKGAMEKPAKPAKSSMSDGSMSNMKHDSTATPKP